MGVNWIEDDWELDTSSIVRTLVLVGRTGNGKSATGNSILGDKAFKSMFSFNGVTGNCELQSTVSEDGLILNIIDTPGLFDFSADAEFVGREIARCIGMAKHGIHAVLVVLSVTSRFTREEAFAIKSLQQLFGDKIVDYMVVIFAGGDVLQKHDETLDDYLRKGCPEPLKAILEMCGNRMVLFDNETCDERRKLEQLRKLLLLVNQVVENNGGKPFSDDIFKEFFFLEDNIFKELKKGAMELRDQAVNMNSLEGYSKQDVLLLKDTSQKPYDELLVRIANMVDAKLSRLEEQLAEEQAARLRADEEMSMLRENFERSQRENEELRGRLDKNKCAIL